MLTQTRFGNVTPRMVRGLKRLGIAFPFGWGLTAVPAGGCIRGTKYGTPGAGALWRALVATMSRWVLIG